MLPLEKMNYQSGFGIGAVLYEKNYYRYHNDEHNAYSLWENRYKI
jgi:hypothetical protein